jgi:hypothetical protein
MEYALTFNQPLDVYDYNTHPETAPIGMQPWKLYIEAMMAAGIVRACQRLDVHTATRVSVREGRRLVQDGPFADTKDLLGGFVIIDVPSLDEALRWAERAPCSLSGSTEVFTRMQTGAK